MNSDPRKGDKITWTERRNGRKHTYAGAVHATHPNRWLVNLGGGKYYSLGRVAWDATGEIVETTRPRLVAVAS